MENHHQWGISQLAMFDYRRISPLELDSNLKWTAYARCGPPADNWYLQLELLKKVTQIPLESKYWHMGSSSNNVCNSVLSRGDFQKPSNHSDSSVIQTARKAFILWDFHLMGSTSHFWPSPDEWEQSRRCSINLRVGQSWAASSKDLKIQSVRKSPGILAPIFWTKLFGMVASRPSPRPKQVLWPSCKWSSKAWSPLDRTLNQQGQKWKRVQVIGCYRSFHAHLIFCLLLVKSCCFFPGPQRILASYWRVSSTPRKIMAVRTGWLWDSGLLLAAWRAATWCTMVLVGRWPFGTQQNGQLRFNSSILVDDPTHCVTHFAR